MSTDPASVNDDCMVARLAPRTDQPRIMSSNFSDFDNDGDGGSKGDMDCDGDATQYTVRPLPRLAGQ